MSRVVMVVGMAWRYALRALEYPARIPRILQNVIGRRAHLGETLNAVRFASLLRHVGIGTVIDVGAHEGEFASGIKSVLPDCHLYSFEPQPAQYAVLAKRLRGYRHAHAFNIALGSSTGNLTLHKSHFTKASSILPMSDLHREAFAWTAGGSDIVVDADTLDNVLPAIAAGRVLLKIDVQGYELEVLRGAAETLAHVDYVLVETSVGGTLYDGEAKFDDVNTLLAGAGFQYAGNWDQMRHPVNGCVLQVDALFRRQAAG